MKSVMTSAKTIFFIGVVAAIQPSFGWYTLKNSTLDTVYSWGDKSSWNNSNQPTNFVADAFYTSVGSGASATRTFVPSGYNVDFTAWGLGQWNGQTSIVHAASGCYFGVHAGHFQMCANSGTAASRAELYLTNSTVKVYNSSGTTARNLSLCMSAGHSVAILGMYDGSVMTNGTIGALELAKQVDATAILKMEDSSLFAPYGSMTFGQSKDAASWVDISLKNSRLVGYPAPEGVTPANTPGLTAYGDVSLSLDHSVFSRTSPLYSSTGKDFGFVSTLPTSVIDIRLRNGSVLNWVNPRPVTGTLTCSGQVVFETPGKIDILIENSSFTNGSCTFAQGETYPGTYAGTAHVWLKGKSSFVSTTTKEMSVQSVPGAEFWLEGGDLDLQMGLSQYVPNLMLDWTYMTNGCSIVRSTGDSGFSSSFVLHPQGGFQLIHTNAIPLIRFRPDAGFKTPRGVSPKGYGQDTDVGDCGGTVRRALLKDLFWQGLTGNANIGNAFGPDEEKTLYGVVFKDTAEVPLATALDTPKPFGFVKLPALVREKYRAARVRFALTPQGTNTVAGLAAQMTAAGYPAAVVDKDGCNVEAELPFEKIRDQSADGKIWFDFTRVYSFEDARTFSITTNAVVGKVVFAPEKSAGLMILLR